MMTTHNPVAVVTGASSGIGFELARQFAGHGFDLLITAEDDRIETAAQQLRVSGVDVTAVQADLRDHDEVERLYAAITATGRPVSAAALNAGVGQGGAFVETDLADEVRRAGMLDTRVGQQSKDDPARVAAQGFEALMAGRDKLVAGSWSTRAQGIANRVLPDKLKAVAHRWMAAPESGDT